MRGGKEVDKAGNEVGGGQGGVGRFQVMLDMQPSQGMITTISLNFFMKETTKKNNQLPEKIKDSQEQEKINNNQTPENNDINQEPKTPSIKEKVITDRNFLICNLT